MNVVAIQSSKFLLFLFTFSLFLFLVQQTYALSYYPPGQDPSDSSATVPHCYGSGTANVPLNDCSTYGGLTQNNQCFQVPWRFRYASACVVSTSAEPECDFEYQYVYNSCNTEDRCWGATVGASGNDAAGRILPGICSASSYNGVDPNSACISGGHYKQCCTAPAPGFTPSTACSNGVCPSGYKTSAGDTTCDAPGPTSTPTPTPTPTATTVPTPTPLPAPTLNGNCSANGTTLSYSWNSITGATRYAIRIDDRTNGWDALTPLSGDTINNNIPSTSTSYPRSSTPGATYDAWIHAVDSRGVYSDASDPHAIFTCPVPVTSGVTVTIAPTPTSSIPTATPIPGCTPCSGVSGSGFCGGQPPIFPAACNANCPSDWVYQGDSVSETQCASPFGSGAFPYCFVCSVPVATPTPDPLATPVPTTIPCGSFGFNTCRSSPPAPGDIGNCRPISCDGNATCVGTCRYTAGTGVEYLPLRSQTDVNLCVASPGPPDYGYGGIVETITWSPTWDSACPGPTPTPITYTVPGIVFIDKNMNGIRDPAGFDRALGTSDDEISYTGGARLFLGTQSTTTDANGAYQFTGVIAGSYTLELDVPFGFSPNKSTGWSATTGTNRLSFTIPPVPTSADFGIVPYEVGIGGTMYTTDQDSCSTSITSLGRLGSKALTLSETYFGLTFNASTDINGVYSFSAPNQMLFPGDYSLTPSGASGMQLICAIADPGTTSATAVTVYDFSLTATNPQKRVDFYYKLGQSWFQGKGGDMRIDSGFIDSVPTSAYAMLSNGRSTGIIFSGGNRYSFCTAGTGICLERASPLANPWVVGGTSSPETFTPVIPGTTRTSYRYLLALIKQNGQTITDLSSGCYSSTGCDLAYRAPGVYKNAAGQNNVYTRTSVNNFNRGNYVFLIDGNLHIQGDIRTVSTPNASTLVVSVSGNITVDKNVGGSPSAPSTHIEGLFSADGSFIIESEAGANAIGSNCNTPSNPDKRLNMEGAVVVNAGFSTGGTFERRRSLCSDNDYPTFYIKERPDFILNAPDFIKHKSFVWQEVAP